MVRVNKPEKQFDRKGFEDFCEKYGLTLPDAFINYLVVNNTGELESNIVRNYEDFSVRYFFGTSSEKYNDIENCYLCYVERIPQKCIPIAEDYCGNLACMSLNDDTYGQIYFWDHETMDVDEGEICEYSVQDMPLLANSFECLLDNIIEYDFTPDIEQKSENIFSKILKKNIWLFSAIILIVVILLGVIYLRHDKVNIDYVKKAEVCFQYGNTDVIHRLSDKEVESIKTIFNGEKMYKDNLSCGFSEAVAIKFDDEHTFCIARDTCPIVYWKEKNRYIRFSEDEKTKLYNLLEPYGFIFPCI